MKRVWMFSLMTVVLWAQNPLYLDLSGDWRTILADDPAYARPDFDDSGWTPYRLPVQRPRGDHRNARWLRRSFMFPAGQKTDELVLTIGGFRKKYEVFVNGVRLGEQSDSVPPDAKMFPVPPRILRSGEMNVIALRAQGTLPGAVPLGVLPNAGPFLLTNQVNAPVWVTEAYHHHRTRYATLGLVAAVVYSMLALLMLLGWLGSRGELGLAALAGGLALEAAQRFAEYYAAFAGLGATPTAGVPVRASFGLIVFALLDQLRIDRRLCSAAALLGFGAYMLGPTPGTAGMYGVFLFGCGWLAYRWRRLSGRQGVVLALLALVLLFSGRIAGSDIGIGVLVAFWDVSGFLFRAFDWAFVVLGLVLVILLMRRLIEDRREKQRLASELEAARAVQQLMLPDSGASTAGFTLDAVYEPAAEVGGDFHWSRTDADGSLIAVVGDVSGKGLKAAMLVSVVIGILRTVKESSPSAILAALNDGLTGHTGGGFVTCCCAHFDPDGTVTMANAGHPAPYCDGREVAVDAGLPLGVVAGAEYEESIVRGERFTFVSDGVVEAENARRELFGFDRTRELSTKSVQEIAEAAKAWGQNDDITVVTVRRTPQ